MGEEGGRKAAPLPKASRARDAAGSPGFHPCLFPITGTAAVPAGLRHTPG